MNAIALVSLFALASHAPDSPPTSHERERDHDRDRVADVCPGDVNHSFDALDEAVRQLDHHVDDLKGNPHERDRVRDDVRDLVKKLQDARAIACRAARRDDKIVVVAPPPPPRVIPVLDQKQAESLRAAVAKESFDEGKLSTLTLGLRGVCVTSEQSRALVKQLDFGSNKLNAVKALAPRIVDVGDEFKILDAFDFDGEKTTVRNILTSAVTSPECRP
jgi:hypothetical protein